jgi:uncharacterized membrane protein YphA (DoxX/SURF4 family)
MGMRNRNIFIATWSLRLLFGLVPIIAGLDKFLNLVTYWPKYVSSIAADVVGVAGLSPQAFMHVVGVIEIVAGAIVLSKQVRFGAYLVSAWLVAIAANLLLAGYYDVAVRDVGLAVAAFALAKLVEARA